MADIHQPLVHIPLAGLAFEEVNVYETLKNNHLTPK
jgi:hypothetical protein